MMIIILFLTTTHYLGVFRNTPLPISYLNSTNELVLGQQNVYYFNAEIVADDFLIGRNLFGLYRNGTFMKTIPEHPFCPVRWSFQIL